MTEVRFLGARGSLPVADPRFSKYGGDTSCVLVKTDRSCIILDAGTGLRNAEPENSGDVHILLSHAHIDHILGLAVFDPMFRGRVTAHLYAKQRNGLGARAQLERLMSEPLWPVTPDVFGSSLDFIDILEDEFMIEDVLVKTTEGNHPGGATVYRLETEDAAVVYCTDFEHGHPHTERITEFAKGCDLLIYDGNYSEAEYPQFTGWGHSTWQMGARIGKAAGAGTVVMFHHSADRTDEGLASIESEFCSAHQNCEFARTGRVFRFNSM